MPKNKEQQDIARWPVTRTAAAQDCVILSMEDRKMTAIEIIKAGKESCFQEWVAQGYDGDASEYEMTEADCDWVVEQVQKQLGRMPTRQDWLDAGFKYVGNKHYDDGR